MDTTFTFTCRSKEIGADCLDDLLAVIDYLRQEGWRQQAAAARVSAAIAAAEAARVVTEIAEAPLTSQAKLVADRDRLVDQLARTRIELTRARKEPEKLRATYQRIIERLQIQICQRRRSAPTKSRS
jgi:hypothetical protein